jgi:hypothetical protein
MRVDDTALFKGVFGLGKVESLRTELIRHGDHQLV